MQWMKELLKGREQCWVHPEETVREAVRYLCQCKTGALLVKEGDAAVGVFSERDLMHRVINEGLNPDTVLVREVMSPALLKIRLNESTQMAKAIMCLNHVRHLAVIGDEGEVLGMISVSDIMASEIADAGKTVHSLNEAYYEKSYRPKWFVSSNRVIVEHHHPKRRT